MYDEAIVLAEKLTIIRTSMDPDTLAAVDKEMDDAAAFAFDQAMGCFMNDSIKEQPPQLAEKRIPVLQYSNTRMPPQCSQLAPE